MKKEPGRKAVQMLSGFVKDIVVVMAGTALSFAFVHVATLRIVEHSGIIEAERFYQSYYVYQMVPAGIAFAFLVSIVWYLYRKTRSMMLAQGERELNESRREAMVATLQKITGLMSSTVARHNAEILEWAAARKARGQEPPGKVAGASMKIAMTVQALSQVSFAVPYRIEEIADVDEYLDLLEKRLQVISRSPAALPLLEKPREM